MGRRAKPDKNLEHVRYAAEIFYTLSTESVSVRDMVAKEQFSMVSVRTMQRWADDGGWWDKRQDNLTKLRNLLQGKLSSRLVAQRSEQMRMMDDIFHQGVSMLADPALQPKNWEGVASTTLKCVEAIDRWGANVRQELTPDELMPHPQGGEELPSHMMPALSEDEARAAARAVVLMRRKAMTDA